MSAGRLRGLTAWDAAALSISAAFLAVQVALAMTRDRGWFIDEAIYIVAGIRTLEGEGFGDGFLSWFSGSLLWPALSGVAYQIGGLEGSRILAAICVTIGVTGSAAAAGALFGSRARFFAALAVALMGPTLALGHLAAYDALAVGAVGVAMWCVVRLALDDDRRWLVAAAIAMTVAFLAKYPSIIFVGPSLVAFLVLMRGRRAVADLTIAAFVFIPIPLALFIEQRGAFASLAANNVALGSDDFGVTSEMLTFSQLYLTAIPVALALAALLITKGRARLAGAVLAAGVLLPALYHVWAGNAVSDQKHVVYSNLLCAPLIGAGLARLVSGPWRAALAVPAAVALAFVAAEQVERLDAAWADPRGGAAYLVDNARPNDTFLINNSWPYILPLYEQKVIDRPWLVFDVYRIEQRQHRQPLCSFDWFVEAPGGSQWPEDIERRVAACGTFRRAYTEARTVTGLGQDLRFITYTAYTTVWKNSR